MPSLTQSLYNHDLGHLRIIAEGWGVTLNAPDTKTALPILNDFLLDAENVQEIYDALPEDAQHGLEALSKQKGRLPWPQFTRQFGEVREIGPGKRDRMRPDRTPVSAAEMLWYRAFIARAFFETPDGLREFAYIPNDLLPLLSGLLKAQEPAEITPAGRTAGRAATPRERAVPHLADDSLLDHVCTLLTAHRMQIDPGSQFAYTQYDLPPFATTLLSTAGLLNSARLPDPEAARTHLAAARGAASLQLVQSWLHSPDHNDLAHVPDLSLDGDWQNDPLDARDFVLKQLAAVPEDTWWSTSAFLADIRRDHPDFQRPAGDYDSWFIRDTRNGEYLRGFENWEVVDGALIRYLLTGPLHWLGVIDLAVPDEAVEPEQATAFRRSKWASVLLSGATPQDFPEEDVALHVRSDGRIDIPVLAPRLARYQIARFCQWEAPTRYEYRVRITPRSLERALDQGLRIRHLQKLLARQAKTVPPNIVQALERWDKRGTEARLQAVEVLRLGSPELLQKLRQSRAARFLGDPLGPTTVIVKPGAGEKVLAYLTEQGYLGEILDKET